MSYLLTLVNIALVNWPEQFVLSARPVAPERIWKLGGGGRAPVRREGLNFFWSCPSTFLALKIQFVVLVSAFVMVSTVWSVSCLLFWVFSYSRCPLCPPICKGGGSTCPPCPMESSPLSESKIKKSLQNTVVCHFDMLYKTLISSPRIHQIAFGGRAGGAYSAPPDSVAIWKEGRGRRWEWNREGK